MTGLSESYQRWDKLLEEDSDLDEETNAARSEAQEVHRQANNLSEHAKSLEPGEGRTEEFRQAIAMYRRADGVLAANAEGRPLASTDRDTAMQCKLNAACLALEIGDEQVVEDTCTETLRLDAENSHAALFLARLATCRGQAAVAEEWGRKANWWADQRGDRQALLKAQSFLDSLNGTADAEEPEDSVAEKVRQGMAFVRDRKPDEAIGILAAAMEQLEQEGKIEDLESRARRALAFNTLESMAEAHAMKGNMPESMRCGQRAVAMIEEPGRFGPPFTEPEVKRREGLLCFSMGHVTKATGSCPLNTWRRAVHALQTHGGHPEEEAQVLLELGLHALERLLPILSNSSANVESEDLEEICVVLDGAAARYRDALVQAAKKESEASGSGADAARRRAWLKSRELQAKIALASFWLALNDKEQANACLDASRGILDLPPQEAPGDVGELLAELCGRWAITGMRLARLAESEEVLLLRQRFAESRGRRDLELAAWKALAVVRRRRGDEVGCQVATSKVEELTQDEADKALQDFRKTMKQLAIDPLPTAAKLDIRSDAVSSPRFSSLGSVLTVLVALIVAILAVAAGHFLNDRAA